MVCGDGRIGKMCEGRCVAGAKSGKAGALDGVEMDGVAHGADSSTPNFVSI